MFNRNAMPWCCRCILQEFMKLGVGMMPKMDNYTALEGLSLGPLMDGVHTKEAIELVRILLRHLHQYRTCAAMTHTATSDIVLDS